MIDEVVSYETAPDGTVSYHCPKCHSLLCQESKARVKLNYVGRMLMEETTKILVCPNNCRMQHQRY
jgi:hypothetical protein